MDSFRMYELLESRGCDLGLSHFRDEERLALQAELELLFGSYALARCGWGKHLAFVRAWSAMRDAPSTWRGPIARALVVYYFHLLIVLGRWRARWRGRAPLNMANFESQLQRWEDRLVDADWFTGSEIGFLDYAVFGHLQCMTSGLTDSLFPALRKRTRLMAWAKRVSARHSDHEPLYVRRLFGDSAWRREASIRDRTVFWCAWVVWLLLFPLTACVVVVALIRRRHNPAHTGGALRRVRQTL